MGPFVFATMRECFRRAILAGALVTLFENASHGNLFSFGAAQIRDMKQHLRTEGDISPIRNNFTSSPAFDSLTHDSPRLRPVFGERHLQGSESSPNQLETAIDFVLNSIGNDDLAQAAAKLSKNNHLVITGSSWGYRGLIMNWILAMELMGVKEYLVLCYDEETLEMLGNWDTPNGHGISATAFSAYTKYLVITSKAVAVSALIDAGYAVTWSDADCLWTHPLLIEEWLLPLSGTVDFIGQQGAWPFAMSHKYGAVACTGFFTVFPTVISKTMFHLVVDAVRYEYIQSGGGHPPDDQSLINVALEWFGGYPVVSADLARPLFGAVRARHRGMSAAHLARLETEQERVLATIYVTATSVKGLTEEQANALVNPQPPQHVLEVEASNTDSVRRAFTALSVDRVSLVEGDRKETNKLEGQLDSSKETKIRLALLPSEFFPRGLGKDELHDVLDHIIELQYKPFVWHLERYHLFEDRVAEKLAAMNLRGLFYPLPGWEEIHTFAEWRLFMYRTVRIYDSCAQSTAVEWADTKAKKYLLDWECSSHEDMAALDEAIAQEISKWAANHTRSSNSSSFDSTVSNSDLDSGSDITLSKNILENTVEQQTLSAEEKAPFFGIIHRNNSVLGRYHWKPDHFHPTARGLVTYSRKPQVVRFTKIKQDEVTLEKFLAESFKRDRTSSKGGVIAPIVVVGGEEEEKEGEEEVRENKQRQLLAGDAHLEETVPRSSGSSSSRSGGAKSDDFILVNDRMFTDSHELEASPSDGGKRGAGDTFNGREDAKNVLSAAGLSRKLASSEQTLGKIGAKMTKEVDDLLKSIGNSELARASAKLSRNNHIVISGATWKYRGFLMNWVLALELLGVTEYLVLCYDDETLNLVGHWDTKYGHGISAKEFNSEQNSKFWITTSKAVAVSAIIDAGYAVTWSDCDCIWVKPGFIEDWVLPLRNQFDIFGQSGIWPFSLVHAYSAVLCTGFFTVYPTEVSKRLFRVVLQAVRIEYVRSNGGHPPGDQELINAAIEAFHGFPVLSLNNKHLSFGTLRPFFEQMKVPSISDAPPFPPLSETDVISIERAFRNPKLTTISSLTGVMYLSAEMKGLNGSEFVNFEECKFCFKEEVEMTEIARMDVALASLAIPPTQTFSPTTSSNRSSSDTASGGGDSTPGLRFGLLPQEYFPRGGGKHELHDVLDWSIEQGFSPYVWHMESYKIFDDRILEKLAGMALRGIFYPPEKWDEEIHTMEDWKNATNRVIRLYDICSRRVVPDSVASVGDASAGRGGGKGDKDSDRSGGMLRRQLTGDGGDEGKFIHSRDAGGVSKYWNCTDPDQLKEIEREISRDMQRTADDLRGQYTITAEVAALASALEVPKVDRYNSILGRYSWMPTNIHPKQRGSTYIRQPQVHSELRIRGSVTVASFFTAAVEREEQTLSARKEQRRHEQHALYLQRREAHFQRLREQRNELKQLQQQQQEQQEQQQQEQQEQQQQQPPRNEAEQERMKKGEEKEVDTGVERGSDEIELTERSEFNEVDEELRVGEFADRLDGLIM